LVERADGRGSFARAAAGLTGVFQLGPGALISAPVGASTWGIYFSGATAAQVQTQVAFF
jgi:hypothetical protein